MIGRTLVTGILVLAALALGAPALFGLYMAREFDEAVARFERPGLTRVIASRFERGWFQSEAMIRLGPADVLCPQRPCASITLDSVIHHGPILFSGPVDFDAGLEPSLGVAVTTVDIATLWPRMVFEPPLAPLSVVTRVGLDGRAQFHLHADGATIDISRRRPIAHIDMDAVTVRASVPLKGGTINAAIEAPEFRLIGETGGQLSWRGLSGSAGHTPLAAATDSPPGLLLDPASQQLHLESLALADGLGSAALFQGVVGQWQPLPADGNRLSGRFGARVARAVIDNNDNGPFMIDGAVQQLEVDAWQALLRALWASLGNQTSAEASDGQRLYGEILSPLLVGRPVIDIQHLRLTTPAGDIAAHLRLAAPEKPRRARLLADIIAQLDVDFGAKVPAQTARDIVVQVMLANGCSPYDIEEGDIDTALAQLIDRKLIEAAPDSNAYRMTLTIKGGRLRLNGRNQIGWQSVVDQFETAREPL